MLYWKTRNLVSNVTIQGRILTSSHVKDRFGVNQWSKFGSFLLDSDLSITDFDSSLDQFFCLSSMILVSHVLTETI